MKALTSHKKKFESFSINHLHLVLTKSRAPTASGGVFVKVFSCSFFFFKERLTEGRQDDDAIEGGRR